MTSRFVANILLDADGKLPAADPLTGLPKGLTLEFVSSDLNPEGRYIKDDPDIERRVKALTLLFRTVLGLSNSDLDLSEIKVRLTGTSSGPATSLLASLAGFKTVQTSYACPADVHAWGRRKPWTSASSSLSLNWWQRCSRQMTGTTQEPGLMYWPR